MRINLEKAADRGIEVVTTETHVEFRSDYNDTMHNKIREFVDYADLSSGATQDLLFSGISNALNRAVLVELVE